MQFQLSEELLWELFVQAGPVGWCFFMIFILHIYKSFFSSCFISVVILIFFFLVLFHNLFFSVNVYVPKDRVTNAHQGYGFVEFRSEEDADYVSLSLG